MEKKIILLISDDLLTTIIIGCKEGFKDGCPECHYFIECEEIQKKLGIIN